MYKKSHTVDSVFVLLVFGLFAVTSLILVLIGANVYRGVVKDTDANNEIRSSLSYVANKVRANDAQGAVTVETKECGNVLTFTSQSEAHTYKTYIYFYNGQLMELFCRAESAFQPQTGTVITALKDFSVQQSGSVLTFFAAGEGQQDLRLQLCLRSVS